MQKSGVAHFAFDNEIETLLNVKKLLSFLPLNFKDKPDNHEFDSELLSENENLCTIIPDNPNKPYDMKEIILNLVDEEDFLKYIKIMQKILFVDLQDSAE